MQKARGQDTYVPPTACKYTVSGSISPPYSGYFAPFLHSTGSLSVTQSYLALPDGAGSFTQGASDPVLLRILVKTTTHYAYRAITCYGLPFQVVPLRFLHPLPQSYNPQAAETA
jgi:hypothetical protein